MKITRVTERYNNDFCADMICEHCGAYYHLTSGYADHHYMNRVIPALTCLTCGKNRAGETTAPNPHGFGHVSGAKS